MSLKNSLADIWNSNLSLIPSGYRVPYDVTKGFSIQERDLRESLINGKAQIFWDIWKQYRFWRYDILKMR